MSNAGLRATDRNEACGRLPDIDSSYPALVDDVVAAVDVKHLAGYESRRVVGEKRGRHADVINVDELVGWCLQLRLFKQRVEFRDTGSGSGGKRPRRYGVDANALGAKLGGHVAHGAFERCLGDPMML